MMQEGKEEDKESSPDNVYDEEENNNDDFQQTRDRDGQHIRRRHNNSNRDVIAEHNGDDSRSHWGPEVTKTVPAEAAVMDDDEGKMVYRGSHRGMIEDHMTENVFSLIYTAPVCSSAFWMGILVSLFQIAMPFLAILDLIVFSNDKNPLQVPNSVSLQVRI
ncbi:unnamed protein product, partial [Cylindrotheca closterium]